MDCMEKSEKTKSCQKMREGKIYDYYFPTRSAQQVSGYQTHRLTKKYHNEIDKEIGVIKDIGSPIQN